MIIVLVAMRPMCTTVVVTLREDSRARQGDTGWPTAASDGAPEKHLLAVLVSGPGSPPGRSPQGLSIKEMFRGVTPLYQRQYELSVGEGRPKVVDP